MLPTNTLKFAFIGSVGIPNRYGGFESFLEHCAPIFSEKVSSVTVTCDASIYNDLSPTYKGVIRQFIKVRANGWQSIFHDGIAFIKVFSNSSHIVVLGVSGGLWFPLMRLLCNISGKRLIVNVDGLEWRRTKFSINRRRVLKFFDALTQYFSHTVIVDNEGLLPFLTSAGRKKCFLIPYSGDHVQAYVEPNKIVSGTALTICRIEPENQLEILIDAAINSNEIKLYTIIGNWQHSSYSLALYENYKNHSKLKLSNPIYNLIELGSIRSSCEFYFHGHSVGGTNPSLVEMLFYNCKIFAFDCVFNKATAKDNALYFKNSYELVQLIENNQNNIPSKLEIRNRYKAANIVDQYLNACNSTK